MKIDVPMTKIAPVYYLSLGISIFFIALYIMDKDNSFGIWSFIIPMIFALIFAFIDYTLAYSVAREKTDKIGNGRKKNHQR